MSDPSSTLTALAATRPSKPWAVVAMPVGTVLGLYEDISRARSEARALADSAPGVVYVTCRLVPVWVTHAPPGELIDIEATPET